MTPSIVVRRVVRRGPSRTRLVVGTAHAGAGAEVGAVHVQGDGDVSPVLWTRWMSSGGATPLTEPVGRWRSPTWTSRSPCDAVEGLGLRALQHHEGAPHEVVVDLGHLARPPHDGRDREARLGVQGVPGVSVGEPARSASVSRSESGSKSVEDVGDPPRDRRSGSVGPLCAGRIRSPARQARAWSVSRRWAWSIELGHESLSMASHA